MPSPDELTYEPSTFDRNGHVIDWRVCRRDDGRTMAITYQENIARDVCGLIRIADGDAVWPTRKVRGPAGEANPCNHATETSVKANPCNRATETSVKAKYLLNPCIPWSVLADELNPPRLRAIPVHVNPIDMLAAKPPHHIREAPAGYPPLTAPPGKAVHAAEAPPPPKPVLDLESRRMLVARAALNGKIDERLPTILRFLEIIP